MTTHAEADGSGYFLYHSIGMYPGKTREVSDALRSVASTWGTPNDAQWPASLEIRGRFLEHWRRCIRARAGTMTAAENVTTALYSLIGSLPDSYLSGRRLLIAADCFPSLHFLLAGMAERRGFVLDTVPLSRGRAWVCDEDFIARWRPDVGVALLTHTTSTASHRCNLDALIAHGHSMGSLVGVDITQSVGIVPFDVESSHADFVVSSTLKWLCGVAGAGVLQVREDLLQECRPELRGWFSQEDIFSWGLDGFKYAHDARRFDHGTPSIMSCAACIPALEWHAAQSLTALAEHNGRLVHAILDAAPVLGLDLVSPREATLRGGSIMLRLPDGSAPGAVIQHLRENLVFADCRGTTLRLSPGNMTTMGGVERLIDCLRTSIGGRADRSR